MITISTISELQLIGNDPSYPLNGDYILTGNIDASATSGWNGGAGFIPIGVYSGSPFIGTLDGAGYTIDGLVINRPSTVRQGIFDYMLNALIKDINFTNVSVTGGDSTGTLAGYSEYCYLYNLNVAGSITSAVADVGGLLGHTQDVVMDNCHGTVTMSGGWRCGGLVGSMYNVCAITNCTAAVTMTTDNDEAGGLIGEASCNPGSMMVNCSTSGTITYVGTGGYDHGGLCGSTQDFTSIYRCSSSVDIISTETDYAGGLVGYSNDSSYLDCFSTGAVSGEDRCGGLLGYARGTSSSIVNCYSTGNVTTNNASAIQKSGGFAGYISQATVTDCYSTGDVNADGGQAGGFAGEILLTATVSQCYSTGAVVAVGDDVGGFVGNVPGHATLIPNITDCYATGAVTGNDSVGGFVGTVGALAANFTNVYSTGLVTATTNDGGLIGVLGVGGVITDSYWDTQTSGQALSAGGTGKTTAEMKLIDTFSNWDFTTPVWRIVETSTYPLLGDIDRIDIEVNTTAIYCKSANISFSTGEAASLSGYGLTMKTPGTFRTYSPARSLLLKDTAVSSTTNSDERI